MGFNTFYDGLRGLQCGSVGFGNGHLKALSPKPVCCFDGS